MKRLRVAAALGVFLVLTGCAGVHRRSGHGPLARAVGDHGPVAHAGDPFLPRTEPAAGVGRYFPSFGRPAVAALPPAEPDLGAPAEARPAPARPRLGWKLFRGRSAAPDDPTRLPEPVADPDGLGRRGRPPGLRAEPPEAVAESPPPRLPVAMIAEVDPASFPRSDPDAGWPRFGAPPIAVADLGRDAAARLVQAEPDDVDPPAEAGSEPDPDAPESDPVPDPFDGFEPPGPPSGLAGRIGGETPEVEAEPEAEPEPEAPAVADASTASSESDPLDPFAGFDAPPPPADADLFAGPPAEPDSATLPRGRRQRYGDTMFPISRRLSPAPLPVASGPEAAAPGRPQWRPGPTPEADPSRLPPATFPPAYYGPGAAPHPPAARPEPPAHRDRFRLFRRWRGEAATPAHPASGLEPDDVPQRR